jgi:hypothetical protein
MSALVGTLIGYGCTPELAEAIDLQIVEGEPGFVSKLIGYGCSPELAEAISAQITTPGQSYVDNSISLGCVAEIAQAINDYIQAQTPATPIPQLALWESNMLTYGLSNGLVLIDPLTDPEVALAGTYYDAEWVYQQIANYTGDNSWMVYAEKAQEVYRDDYLLVYLVLPAYWAFPNGILRDWQTTADPVSANALVVLATDTSYANDLPPAVTEPAELSREVAYLIRCFLASEQVGEARKARLTLFVTQALGHLDQWTVSETAPYCRPFMVALTCQALIKYNDDTPDARILPAITIAADWIWDNCWLPDSQAFAYTDRYVSDPADTDPAPDLNLLIAPLYAWLWKETGTERFLTRGDAIFAGGVTQAWLPNGKQFNQNYTWSFDYVTWRS